MKPFILAIAGGSASGKSTIVNTIDTYFGDDLVVIGHDNYYKAHDDIPMQERLKLNYDKPDSFDNDLFYYDLVNISNGRSINMPTYDYKVHNRSDEVIHVEPRKIVLVEGILVLYEKRLRDLYDTMVFVDADSDVRLQRRILRDTIERDRSLESVLNQYIHQVKPMHEKYVEPTKSYADIIIPRGASNTRGIDILIEHIERMIEE